MITEQSNDGTDLTRDEFLHHLRVFRDTKPEGREAALLDLVVRELERLYSIEVECIQLRRHARAVNDALKGYMK